MSRPTDRQLLEEVHFRICNPVLFPQLERTLESEGPLMPGMRYVTPINLGNAAMYSLMLETEVTARLAFKYRWKWDGFPSRDFFAQICASPTDA